MTAMGPACPEAGPETRRLPAGCAEFRTSCMETVQAMSRQLV